MLDFFGGDKGHVGREILEQEFPDRQHGEAPVADDADVEFPALDVFLDDGVGLQLSVDVGDPLCERSVAMDHRRPGNPERCVLHQALHDDRVAQVIGKLPSVTPPYDHESRHLDAVIQHNLLGLRLVAGQYQPAGVVAGVGDPEQLQVADDVVIEKRLAVKLLQQVEHDVRVPRLNGFADGEYVVLHAEGPYHVP